MAHYAVRDELLIYLLNLEMDGSPERKVAAKFLLDCLRRFHSPSEIVDCIHELEEQALLDVSAETRKLAANIGLPV